MENINSILTSSKPKRKDLKIFFDEEKDTHYLPISIIKGKESGKTFTILAGVHGYEYPPIIALQEILKEINPEELKGSIIIIPIANIGAFYHRRIRVNPDDNLNLNYIFPGKENGSITEKIAHYITTQIIPISDVFLDIHCGDANEDLFPFSCYYDDKNNPENTATAQHLCEISGLPFVVSYPYDISPTEPAKYAFKQAVQNRIVALSLEAGKLGNLQKDATKSLKNSVYRMLHSMNIYSDKDTDFSETKVKHLYSPYYISVPETGFFYSQKKAGDIVEQGDNLGYISDEFGNKLKDIITPESGIILYKIGTPPVNKNETLFCIAPQ